MDSRGSSPREPLARALFISGIYLALGLSWILASDHVAFLIAGEASRLMAFQRIKGIGYVVVTAIGLFFLIHDALRSLRRTERGASESRRERDELGAYLQAIIEAAPVAIFDLDRDARVVSIWNLSAESMFGYRRCDALGVRLPLTNDQEWEAIREARDRVTAGEAVPLLEMDLARKDGSSFPAVVSAAPVPGSTGLRTVVIVSDATPIRSTMDRLHAAVLEREVLLREIHHRVKNNLQIISSLLVLERRDEGEPRGDSAEASAFARTLARVRTIARVHEQLYYGDNLSRIDLGIYLRGLISDAMASYDPQHRLDVRPELAEVLVDVDRAVPIGLILHELLARTCRDAHRNNDAPVLVRVRRHEDGVRIEVGCDGVHDATAHETHATENNGAADSSEEIGMTLVRALARQLDGEVRLCGGDGTLGVVVEARLARNAGASARTN